MPQPRLNEFSENEFTEEELKVAVHFNDLNILFIQNERAKLAAQKLNLRVRLDIPRDQAFREFELVNMHIQGQLDFIAWLIAVALGNDPENVPKEQPKIESPNP